MLQPSAEAAPSANLRQLAALCAATPTDPSLQYRYGLACQRAGKLPDAIQAYSRACALKPAEALYAAALARAWAAIPNYQRASFWYRTLLLLRPKDARLVWEFGRFALAQHQPLDAELILKPALITFPNEVEGWLLLGQCYQDLKLASEAAECLKKAAALKPPDAQLLQRLITLYDQIGQPTQALPYLLRLQRLRPQDAAVAAQLGDCQLALRDEKSALVAYRQAAKLAPRVPLYHLALAELLEQPAPAEAVTEYAAAFALQQATEPQLLAAAAAASRAGDPRRAAQFLTWLVALKPQATEPRQRLSEAALIGGDMATALLQGRELSQAGQRQYALQEATLAHRLGGRAWTLGRLEAMAPDPSRNPELAAQVAMLWAQLGELPRAVEVAEKVAISPAGATGARLQAAQVLLQGGRVDQAETLCREALGLDQSNSLARRVLAECLLTRQQAQEAYDLLLQGLPTPHPDRAYCQTFIKAAEACDQLPQAGEALATVATTDPENDDVLPSLVAAYRRQGGTALAARQLAALSDTRPHSALLALAAVRELAAVGQWSEALTVCERLGDAPETAAAPRVTLYEALLAGRHYPELFRALVRLNTSQTVGAEPYKLLTQLQAEANTWETGQVAVAASAAVALCVAAPQSEQYYQALAELFLVVKQAPQGLAYLQQAAARPEHTTAAAVGLSRLLRSLGRSQEALVWLRQGDQSGPATPALLERARCLLALGTPREAVRVAEQVLQADHGSAALEAHLIAAEGYAASDPERALWHSCRALQKGVAPPVVEAIILKLCGQKLRLMTLENALQDLCDQGQSEMALRVAEQVSSQSGLAGLNEWCTRHRLKTQSP